MSTRAKIIIAPAMNENMYLNPIVQGNIKKLKSQGVHFIGPVKGKLACTDTGLGCLAPAEVIVKETKRIIDKK